MAPSIAHNSDHNLALSPREQLLITLRYFATGAFFRMVADGHGPSEATVCRAVHRVTDAIIRHCPQAVSWPSDPRAITDIKHAFYQVAGISEVVGCIDGTHIPVCVPRAQREAFINRKGFPSINVMTVARPDRAFLAASAHCGGRVHDARVLAISGLPEFIRAGNPAPNAVLLGDSAYGLTPWLLTPLANPTTYAERQYNFAHARTRVAVENAFGTLKMRFPVLMTGLRLKKIERSVAVIRGCFALHNLCIAAGDAGDWLGFTPADEPQHADQPADAPVVGAERRDGIARRNDVIRVFARGGAE